MKTGYRKQAIFDIYLGKVRIDGQDFDIPVHVGEGSFSASFQCWYRVNWQFQLKS